MLRTVVLSETHSFAVWRAITLQEAAVQVLSTEDLQRKADMSVCIASLWSEGVISDLCSCDEVDVEIPNKPARPAGLAREANVPKVNSVVTAIHGIAHAESWAMDLFWDFIARYAKTSGLPVACFNELVTIAAQEARHFCDWKARLESYGCAFGCLPTHDGLWRSAEETVHDVCARLAVVNLLYEARGLDTYPLTLKKFENCKDHQSVAVLNRNFSEEIVHVQTGIRWFEFICKMRGLDPVQAFHEYVRKYHIGPLRGPFNTSARGQAGMSEQWYLPLTEQR